MYSKSQGIGITKEFEGVRLNDERLRKRLSVIANGLAKAPSLPLSAAFSEVSEVKATCRFFDNKKVHDDELQFAHRQQTLERMNGLRQVLIIQDTMQLSFDGRLETNGLGGISNHPSKDKGLHVHNSFAFDPCGKIPLGIVDQQIWARENCGKKDKKPSERESFKWIRSVRSVQELFSKKPEIDLIHVADCKSDITELLNETLNANCRFLIRAQINRVLSTVKGESDSKLWDTMRALPVRRGNFSI